VGELSADQVSWAIRLGAVEHGDDQGARVFDELVEQVPELLAQSFPPSCGYEAHGVRLGGPVDGVRWEVTRGPFRAELGLQRYRCIAGPGPRATTVRLVASAGLCEGDSTNTEQLERRVMGWAMAGWALGSVALGVLLLSFHGLGPVWAEALLLIPAVAAWRASVAVMLRRALPPAPERLALPAEGIPAVDGLRRWRELLPTLRAQHDLLQAAMGQAPFRSPGHLGATVDPRARVHQVLAAASSSFTWPRPAFAAAERRQRSCSASTGKNDAYATPDSG
jgi:hypothetical protein